MVGTFTIIGVMSFVDGWNIAVHSHVVTLAQCWTDACCGLLKYCRVVRKSKVGDPFVSPSFRQNSSKSETVLNFYIESSFLRWHQLFAKPWSDDRLIDNDVAVLHSSLFLSVENTTTTMSNNNELDDGSGLFVTKSTTPNRRCYIHQEDVLASESCLLS